MSHAVITNRLIDNLKPGLKPYFVRDTKSTGFGVKVNPSGSVKYYAEAKHIGRTYRKTLGEYPLLTIEEARREAIRYLSDLKSGRSSCRVQQKPFNELLLAYIASGRLKQRTIQDYQEAIGFYLEDWLDKPVSAITKPKVEKRFVKIRDKGINGGRPTYSQATKTMRILSALMNYAMADGLIESNPVDILKQKRIDRSIRKREHYLPKPKVRELLDKTAQDKHPVTLAVQLMLHTGLRKNEALRLKWDDLKDIEGIPCLIIGDTKNHRPQYVPVTEQIQAILNKAHNDSEYVFQSTQRKGHCVNDVRPKLRRLVKLIDLDFRCHDLRRTFATRASEVGIDFLMIKRMLNHKSNDITGQYIQRNSRQNLIVMHDALEQVQY